jgi:hypothetical protein
MVSAPSIGRDHAQEKGSEQFFCNTSGLRVGNMQRKIALTPFS